MLYQLAIKCFLFIKKETVFWISVILALLSCLIVPPASPIFHISTGMQYGYYKRRCFNCICPLWSYHIANGGARTSHGIPGSSANSRCEPWQHADTYGKPSKSLLIQQIRDGDRRILRSDASLRPCRRRMFGHHDSLHKAGSHFRHFHIRQNREQKGPTALHCGILIVPFRGL